MIKIRTLRVIGILEGVSYLVLLGIAMPLKYIYAIPEAVKFTGWAHGVLFMAYIPAVFIARKAMNSRSACGYGSSSNVSCSLV